MSDAILFLHDVNGGELIKVPGTVGSDGVVDFGLAERVPPDNIALAILRSLDGGASVNVPVTIEDDGRVILGSASDTAHNQAYLPVSYNGVPLNVEVAISSAGALTISGATFENPAVAPTYDSSEIGNVDESTVVVRFSIPVSASNYATGVVIKKNTVQQNISSATRQTNHEFVAYVLDTPADANDTVTWEYTAAGSNIVSEYDATALGNVTAKTVTNHIGAIPPEFVSAEIGAVADTTVAVEFTTLVSAAGNDYSTGVTIKVNTVAAVIASGTRQADHHFVRYVIPAVDANDVVTWEYSQTTGLIVNEDDGGVMATLAAQPVTNTVAEVPPEFSTGEIGTVDASTIVVTYTTKVLSSDYKVGISVEVNAAPATVSTATRQANHAIVRYVLSAPVVNGDTVTLSYDTPTGDYENEDDGALMADITDQAITNNVAP